jgi:hypothetical protein
MTLLSWGLCVLVFGIAFFLWGHRIFPKKPPSPTDLYGLVCGDWFSVRVPYAISKDIAQAVVLRVETVLKETWPKIVSIYGESFIRPTVSHLNIWAAPWPCPDGIIRSTAYSSAGLFWSISVNCPNNLLAEELHSILRHMLNIYQKPERLDKAEEVHTWIAEHYSAS